MRGNVRSAAAGDQDPLTRATVATLQRATGPSPAISSANLTSSHGGQRPAFTDRPSPAGSETGGDYQTEKQKQPEQSNARKPEQDEVTKLRKLLSAATEELSRQISSLTHKKGQDDRLFSPKSIAFYGLRAVYYLLIPRPPFADVLLSIRAEVPSLS